MSETFSGLRSLFLCCVIQLHGHSFKIVNHNAGTSGDSIIVGKCHQMLNEKDCAKWIFIFVKFAV